MVHKGFLHRILFLDIETVPISPCFDDLSMTTQGLFERKTQYLRRDGVSAADYYTNAGIWAEFGRIICISTAYFNKDQGKGIMLKSFFNDDERSLLLEFRSLLDSEFNTNTHLLCAHNGKEFDFPFLARRMIVNRIKLPDILNLSGKKPWQIRHLDTMELWKFGDYKHFTSLDLLTRILQIPSPKIDLKGEDIARVYYKENDLNRIVSYCERDTIAVAQVYLRLQGMSTDFYIVRNGREGS